MAEEFQNEFFLAAREPLYGRDVDLFYDAFVAGEAEVRVGVADVKEKDHGQGDGVKESWSNGTEARRSDASVFQPSNFQFIFIFPR
jgi:hypothetical protein